MKKSAHSTRRSPRAMVTTIGELISAAYETVPGAGAQKLERALKLLTRSPLARQLHPHVVFVR
jgi:hypothetical protein